MSRWDEIKSQLDNQKQEQFNSALGFQRKPKIPSDPGYNVREELANSLRPKPYADRFNDYMNQRVASRMASATRSSDPDLADLDRQEADTRAGMQNVFADYLAEKQQEADRHKADPKRQRWSAIASAATDAISGIAGMIGVANGAVHPASLSSIPAASKVSSDHYENERKKRQAALAELHDAQMRNYKQALADVEASRRRLYEKQQRERDRKKQEQQESLYPYQLAKAKSEAESAANRARLSGVNADDQHAINQATIGAKNRSNTGSHSGRSGKKTKTSLAGFSSRWSYNQ